MAMTREPSPENIDGHQRPDTAVQVTEPMGSLYEVTRLRNIRSNQARVSRPGLESSGQVEDFIARGVR